MPKNKTEPTEVVVVGEFGTYVRSAPFWGRPGEKYPVTLFSTAQLDQHIKSGHLRYVEADKEIKTIIEIVEETQDPTIGE